MNKPVFSVIIPCYNHEKYLKLAVESVLAQDFPDWELIIVNDGSSDQSEEIAWHYAQADSRVRVITQVNSGLSAARNTGIAHAIGDWYLFCDADDFYLPNALSGISAVIKYGNALQIIQAGYHLIDKNGNLIRKKTVSGGIADFYEVVKRGNPGPPLTICINAILVRQIGLFDTELKSAEDWDFWLRAAKAGAQRIVLNDYLMAYRYSSGSMSRNAVCMYENIKKVIRRIGLRDDRVLIASHLNFGDFYLPFNLIKQNLIQCTSVLIMQNRMQDAINLFVNESALYKLEYVPQDFSRMNSYLTFGDRISKEDAQSVPDEYAHLYRAFFDQLGVSVLYKKLALFFIFKSFYSRNRISRFGWLGSVLNRIHMFKHTNTTTEILRFK